MRILYLLILFISLNSFSQTFAKERFQLGLNYGQAAQNVFIFNDPDYDYSNRFLKAQVNYTLFQKNKWKYELTIEPSIYFVKYQLLNEYFIRPETENYLELRALYTQKRSFNEYALNIGFVVRYSLLEKLSTYLQGSVGPMISGDNTERLKKGFAFSDILGLGFTWKQKRVSFDLRVTLRHNSNLDFAFPNSGHNSAGVESGVLFQL